MLLTSLRRLISISLLAGLAACSVARTVRPVGAGKAAIGLSLGGPIFSNIGAPAPVPLTVIHGRYGLTDNLDLQLGIHPPIIRTTGIDVGVAYLLLQQDHGIPAITATGRVMFFGNGRALTRTTDPNTGKPFALDARLFEEIEATASWLVDDWLLYTGLSLFAQAEHANFRPTFFGGTQWRAKPWLGLQLEAKWMAFLSDNRQLSVAWQGIGPLGTLGFQLGLTYYFAAGGT